MATISLLSYELDGCITDHPGLLFYDSELGIMSVAEGQSRLVSGGDRGGGSRFSNHAQESSRGKSNESGKGLDLVGTGNRSIGNIENTAAAMGMEEECSPMSPSSSFSVSSIGNIEHSFVDALLLCGWDNILGPRLEHVWYVRGRPQPHTNILRYVTTQALSGEICRDVLSNQVNFS